MKHSRTHQPDVATGTSLQPSFTALTPADEQPQENKINILRDYFGDDYAAASKIYKIFIEESIPEINNWNELLNTGGIKALGRSAHKLKPVLEMLGLHSLSHKCFEVEQACGALIEESLLKEKIKKIKSDLRKQKPHLLEQYYLFSKMANKND